MAYKVTSRALLTAKGSGLIQPQRQRLKFISLLALLLTIGLTQAATHDCRVIPPQTPPADQSVLSSGTPRTVQITDAGNVFGITGLDCLGGAADLSYTVVVDYSYFGADVSTFATILGSTTNPDNIQVSLDDTNNDLLRDQDFAIYVQATDSSNEQSTEWTCFTYQGSGAGSPQLCKPYCLTQLTSSANQLQASKSVHQEYYFVLPTGSSLTPLEMEVAQEQHISSNEIACPISIESPNPSTFTDYTATYDVTLTTGSFSIEATDTNLYDPSPSSSEFTMDYLVGFRDYEWVAGSVPPSVLEYFTFSQNFMVLFSGCLQESVDSSTLPSVVLEYYVFGETTTPPDLVQRDQTYQASALPLATSSKPLECPLTYTIARDSTTFADTADATIELTQDTDGVRLTVSGQPAHIEKLETVTLIATNPDGVESSVTFDVDFKDCQEDSTKCTSCSLNELASDYENLEELKSNSLGCTKCVADAFEPFLNYDDGESKVIRECQATGTPQQYAQCYWGALYVDDGTGALSCTSCSQIIQGCPFCTDQRTCLQCEAGKVLNTFTNELGQEYDVCLDDTCYNCGQCEVQDCKNCQASTKDSKCTKCKPGFALVPGTPDTCDAYASADVNEIEYFVDTSLDGKGYLTDVEITEINARSGTTPNDAFPFIQSALNYLYTQEDVTSREANHVTIYLAKGDHFFFQCSLDYNQMSGVNFDPAQLTNYCDRISSLLAVYPPTDNVSITFKPLVCTDKASFSSSSVSAWSISFDAQCVSYNLPQEQQVLQGPTVYVMDEHATFNVTNSATFENLYFSGLQALAVPTGDANPLPVNAIPLKKCSLTSPATGRHEALVLEKDSTTASSISSIEYDCLDEGFEEAALPMQPLETCDPKKFEAQDYRGIRSCPGDPYHESYFTKDSQTGYHYERRSSLFNLYAFDGVHSDSVHVPSLTLRNCHFEYFLKDHEALIFVETSNFEKQSERNTIVQMGEDRGARILIEDSSVSNSRFCKGMLVYKKAVHLELADGKLVYMKAAHLNSADFDGVLLSFSTHRKMLEIDYEEPFIKVLRSTFDNLNFGVVTRYLSLEGWGLANLYGEPSVRVPTFDNKGIVINAQGFPGPIELMETTMTKNMAFIADIYPSLRKAKDAAELRELYADNKLRQISMTRCTSDGVLKRLFSDYLTAYEEHNDQFLYQMERISPVYISKQEKPLIVRDSTFEDNIGIFGGAILIDSPNFQANGANEEESLLGERERPYIVLKDNKFVRNSAYSAGNAVYVRSTRARNDIERFETCGGFFADSNTFQDNISITKSHNGGAIVLACDYVTEQDIRYIGATSNYHTGTPDRRIFISDIVTPDQFKIYRNSHALINNLFKRNTSGQKGSAIYTRQLSHLYVKDNVFEMNSAHFSFFENAIYEEEIVQAPYYKYLTLESRSSSFADPTGTVSDEFEFLQTSAKEPDNEGPGGGVPDLASIQGTVHVEQCHTCYVSYFKTKDDCDFCYFLTNVTHVEGNMFRNNAAGPSFYAKQTMPRASQLFIQGGVLKVVVQNNDFRDNQRIETEIADKLLDYVLALHPDYFKADQAPLVRIDVPKSVDLILADEWYTTNRQLKHEKLVLAGKGEYNFVDAAVVYDFTANRFYENKFTQTFFQESAFKGSLIQFESETEHARLHLRENHIRENVFVGESSALIYSEGGVVSAVKNEFMRNGLLSSQTYTSWPKWESEEEDVDDKTPEAEYFPINLKAFQSITQEKGAFWLKSSVLTHDPDTAPTIGWNLFVENTFEFMFCRSGCVFSQEVGYGRQATFTNHTGNTYRNIFAEQGAVSHVKVVEKASGHPFDPDFDSFAILYHEDEDYQFISSGIHLTEGSDHEIMQMYKNVHFKNNFAPKTGGALLDFRSTSGMYCMDCTFEQDDLRYNWFDDILNHFDTWLLKHENLERVTFDSFMDTQAQDELLVPQVNQEGVIRLNEVNQLSLIIKPDSVTIPGNFDGSLTLLLETKFGVEGLPANSASKISYSKFDKLLGNEVSAVKIHKSALLMHEVTFTNNLAQQFESSTVKVTDEAYLAISSSVFTKNTADKGGAWQVSLQSTLTADAMTFEENYAKNDAGVGYADQESVIHIGNSHFIRNQAANEGATFVSQNINVFTITDSHFDSNKSRQNLISLQNSRMVISDSELNDNQATIFTHGVFLYNSHLTCSKVTINNSADKWDVSDSQVLSGFFQLTAKSSLNLLDGSTVRNTFGDVASTVLLQADSSIFVQDSTFIENGAKTQTEFQQTGVIVGHQSSYILVENSVFSGNRNSAIDSDRTPVEIRNSTFTDGNVDSFVKVAGESLIVYNSLFKESADYRVLGKGIKCIRCTNVQVTGSTFKDLGGRRGGSIYLQNSQSSLVENSKFTSNTAEQGGALYLYHSDVLIKNSQFKDNKAEIHVVESDHSGHGSGSYSQTQDVTHEGSGAAIFFTCVDLGNSRSHFNPTTDQEEHEYSAMKEVAEYEMGELGACNVELQSNKFVDNEASNKGGALMWTNKNFTSEFAPVADPDEPDVIVKKDTNVFEGNKAIYGESTGSFPAYIEVKLVEEGSVTSAVYDTEVVVYDPRDQFRTPDEEEEAEADDSLPLEGELRALVDTNGERLAAALKIVSGQTFAFNVTIYDQDGQVYNDDSLSTAILQFYPSVPADSYMIGNQAISQNGTFKFSQVRIHLKPNSQHMIQIQIANLANYGNYISFLDTPTKVMLTMRKCVSGEQYTTMLTCEMCPAGYYLIEPQTNPGTCLLCLAHAICYGGNVTAPMPGYQKLREDSEIFTRCFFLDACLGGNFQDPLGTCKDGYEGVLCAQCIDGYWQRHNTFRCKKCSSGILPWIFLVFIIVIALLVIQLLYKIFQRSSSNLNNGELSLAKIFISYFHTLYIMSKLEVMQGYNLVYYIQLLLDYKVSLIEMFVWMIVGQCTSSDDHETYFYKSLVLMSLLPFFILLGNLVFWLLYQIVSMPGGISTCGKNWKILKSKVVLTSTICLYLVYPFIIEYLFSAISCFKSVDNTGFDDREISRLRILPDIVCNTSKHLWYKWFVAIPGIVVWVIAFPILFLYKMHTHQENIINMTKDVHLMDIDAQTYSEMWKQRYGFALFGYRLIADPILTSKKKKAMSMFAKSMTFLELNESTTDKGKKNFAKRTCSKIFRFTRILLSAINGEGVELMDDYRSFYYWELVIYLRKVILIIVVIFSNGINVGLQLNIILAILALFWLIQTHSAPLLSKTLNHLEILVFLLFLVYIYCRVLLQGFGIVEDEYTENYNVYSGTPQPKSMSPELTRDFSRTTSTSRTVMNITIIFILFLAQMYLDFQFIWIVWYKLLNYFRETQMDTMYRMFTLGSYPADKFLENYKRYFPEAVTDKDGPKKDQENDLNYIYDRKNIQDVWSRKHNRVEPDRDSDMSASGQDKQSENPVDVDDIKLEEKKQQMPHLHKLTPSGGKKAKMSILKKPNKSNPDSDGKGNHSQKLSDAALLQGKPNYRGDSQGEGDGSGGGDQADRRNLTGSLWASHNNRRATAMVNEDGELVLQQNQNQIDSERGLLPNRDAQTPKPPLGSKVLGVSPIRGKVQVGGLPMQRKPALINNQNNAQAQKPPVNGSVGVLSDDSDFASSRASDFADTVRSDSGNGAGAGGADKLEANVGPQPRQSVKPGQQLQDFADSDIDDGLGELDAERNLSENNGSSLQRTVEQGSSPQIEPESSKDEADSSSLYESEESDYPDTNIRASQENFLGKKSSSSTPRIAPDDKGQGKLQLSSLKRRSDFGRKASSSSFEELDSPVIPSRKAAAKHSAAKGFRK